MHEAAFPRVESAEYGRYLELTGRFSIVKGAGGEWIASQLKVACNKPVKEATRLAVEEWLRAPQIGI